MKVKLVPILIGCSLLLSCSNSTPKVDSSQSNVVIFVDAENDAETVKHFYGTEEAIITIDYIGLYKGEYTEHDTALYKLFNGPNSFYLPKGDYYVYAKTSLLFYKNLAGRGRILIYPFTSDGDSTKLTRISTFSNEWIDKGVWQ